MPILSPYRKSRATVLATENDKKRLTDLKERLAIPPALPDDKPVHQFNQKYERELIRCKLYYTDVKQRWGRVFNANEFRRVWFLVQGYNLLEIAGILHENPKLLKRRLRDIEVRLISQPDLQAFVKKYAGKPGLPLETPKFRGV